MASSRHKTHKGREFNMAAFVDRNAETRAIGNVPMNARGDIVDSKGNAKVTSGKFECPVIIPKDAISSFGTAALAAAK